MESHFSPLCEWSSGVTAWQALLGSWCLYRDVDAVCDLGLRCQHLFSHHFGKATSWRLGSESNFCGFYFGGGSCVTLCLRDVRTVIPVGPLLYRVAPSQSFAVCSFLVQANHSLANVTAGDRRQLSSSSSSLLSPLFYSYFYRCFWNGCCRNNVCTLIADLVGHQQSRRADLWLSYLALWSCCTWPCCPVWNPAMCLFVSLPLFSPHFRQSLESFYYLECSVRALAKSIMCQACWQKKGCTIDKAETCQVFWHMQNGPLKVFTFWPSSWLYLLVWWIWWPPLSLRCLGEMAVWCESMTSCHATAEPEVTHHLFGEDELVLRHWKRLRNAMECAAEEALEERSSLKSKVKEDRHRTSHDPCDPKKDTALRCSKFTSTHAWKRGLLQELECQGPMPLQENPAVSPSFSRQAIPGLVDLFETLDRDLWQKWLCVRGGRSIKKTAKRPVQSSMSRAD